MIIIELEKNWIGPIFTETFSWTDDFLKENNQWSFWQCFITFYHEIHVVYCKALLRNEKWITLQVNTHKKWSSKTENCSIYWYKECDNIVCHEIGNISTESAEFISWDVLPLN